MIEVKINLLMFLFQTLAACEICWSMGGSLCETLIIMIIDQHWHHHHH